LDCDHRLILTNREHFNLTVVFPAKGATMKPAKFRIRVLFCSGLMTATWLAASLAKSEVWTQTGSGPFSWNDPANWDLVSVPNSAGATASFTTGGGPGSQDVTLDAAITVGTLDLSNSSTSYAIANGTGGSFTFDNGGNAGTINLASGGVAQTVNADIALTSGMNVTNDNAVGGSTLTLGGAISGTGPLTKLGTGTLVLSGANSFSGNTYFGPTTGTGAINAGTIILSGGNNILPTNSVINFHPTTYPFGTLSGLNYSGAATYTSTLDIGPTSQTLSTIHLPGAGVVGGSVQVFELPTGANVTITGSGGTLTLNGESFYVGIANNTNGLNPGGITHTVNMSGLTNFVFDNPNKEVGVHLSGSRVNSINTIVGTLTLASNSTVNAANLVVGDFGPSGVAGGGRSILNLGNGTTILNIGPNATQGRINVGYSGRSRADLVLAAGGNLTIRGFGGGSTPLPEFMIGLGANSNSTNNFTDTVNFSAGTVNAIVTRLDLSTSDNASGGRGGGNTSNFTLGATSGPEGFTVETLNIGRIIGGGVGLVQPFSSTATFTINNPSGVLNATTINLAENTITDTSATAKTVTATLALTSGTIKATTIQLGTQGGTATVNRSLAWANGTIENPTGGDTAINGIPIVLSSGTHTFNATGSNAITLDTDSIISGAGFGVTKEGTGTVLFNGANTYTGDTTVNAGTLEINGQHTVGNSYYVAPNGKLVANTIRVGTLVVDGVAEVRADGGAVGASMVESLVIGAGQLNLKNNDLIIGTGNLLDVRSQIKLGVSGVSNTAAATGITSDLMTAGVHGFGYALGDDVNRSPLIGGPGAGGTLSGLTYDADSVLVKFTYRGDADLDGDSDLDDLGFWANAFTGDLGLGSEAAPTTLWTQGDWDYDGDTDLDDLGFWSSTFTGDLGGGGLSVYTPYAPEGAIAALAQMGITAVPEPVSSSLLVLGLGAVTLQSLRRRRIG
jgi:autotransporter-associated beta strand protein